MKEPTVLDFAVRYGTPIPAAFNGQFEAMAPSERQAAFDFIPSYREQCRRTKVTPMDPISYLRLQFWKEANARAQALAKDAKVPSRHSVTRRFVEAVIPPVGSQPLTAREIHMKSGYGSPSTTRAVLRELLAEGKVMAMPLPGNGACAPTRVFRRASS